MLGSETDKKHRTLFEKGNKLSSHRILNLELGVWGENEDITNPYYWFNNFGLFINKGYFSFKIEDNHYFSENSQFGANQRQIKGGAIQAFQSNVQALILLIKQHLLPLFQEIKKAHFYKLWIDKIVNNNEEIKKLNAELKLLSKESEIKAKKAVIEKLKLERNEAIRTLKDKWVSEVDGGRMWQINKSAAEQGLDFVLLPQLFFGTNLEDPLNTATLKEQLDKIVYEVTTSLGAKEQAASFLFRFYMWLPTAIRDTQITFKLKVAALKNIYAQVLMYGNLLKPILKEIYRKSENFDISNSFADFDLNNPEFVNMLDSSYSNVRILRIFKFEPYLKKTAFKKYGFYIEDGINFESQEKFDQKLKEIAKMNSNDMKEATKNYVIERGEMKYRKGYIVDVENETSLSDCKYVFVACDNPDIKKEDFDKLPREKISRTDLKGHNVIENVFTQNRRNEIKQTPQGPAQIPFMKNKLLFSATALNLFEIACYKKKFELEDVDLIGALVSEVAVIKDELLKYVEGLETGVFEDEKEKKAEVDKKPKEKSVEESSDGNNLVLGPFKGIWELIKLPVTIFKFESKEEAPKKKDEDPYKEFKTEAVDDMWKAYGIYKKINGFFQYP